MVKTINKIKTFYKKQFTQKFNIIPRRFKNYSELKNNDFLYTIILYSVWIKCDCDKFKLKQKFKYRLV